MSCPTREATSSGVPMRSAGISSMRASISSFAKHRFISVSITPQATAFTCILLGASSLAKALVKLFTAPFDAE